MLHLFLSKITDEIENWGDKALLLAIRGGYEPSIRLLASKLKPWIDQTPELKLMLLRAAAALSVPSNSLKPLLLELLQQDDITGRHDQVLPGKNGWDYKTIDALILVAGNSDIDLRDDQGKTPLSWIASRGDHATARILELMGANISAIYNQGETHFLSAAKRGDHAATQFLPTMGADMQIVLAVEGIEQGIVLTVEGTEQVIMLAKEGTEQAIMLAKDGVELRTRPMASSGDKSQPRDGT